MVKAIRGFESHPIRLFATIESADDGEPRIPSRIRSGMGVGADSPAQAALVIRDILKDDPVQGRPG
jgi:hypothetical protein